MEMSKQQLELLLFLLTDSSLPMDGLDILQDHHLCIIIKYKSYLGKFQFLGYTICDIFEFYIGSYYLISVCYLMVPYISICILFVTCHYALTIYILFMSCQSQLYTWKIKMAIGRNVWIYMTP